MAHSTKHNGKDAARMIAKGWTEMETNDRTVPWHGIGETVCLSVPADWWPIVDALLPLCQFGPNYSRGVSEALLDVSLFAGRADFEAAGRALMRAQVRAGVSMSATADDGVVSAGDLGARDARFSADTEPVDSLPAFTFTERTVYAVALRVGDRIRHDYSATGGEVCYGPMISAVTVHPWPHALAGDSVELRRMFSTVDVSTVNGGRVSYKGSAVLTIAPRTEPVAEREYRANVSKTTRPAWADLATGPVAWSPERGWHDDPTPTPPPTPKA